MESLAMVNDNTDTSSDSCGRSEDSKGIPQHGDIYVGHFGDVITCKNKNTLRLGFQNVGGFPTQRGKIKDDTIRVGLTKWDFDIFGFAETNLDWRLLPEEDKFPSRTQEWWETQHVSWTNNRTAPPRQARQFGGTALFSINQVAHRVVEKGSDETNLGRWTWTRYQGRNSQTLRVVVAYRPNPPQGPFTVYAQQNAFFNSIGREICPRRAFLLDLVKDLQKFIELGDNVILLIDGNSNMKQSDLKAALVQIDMEEVIIGKHGLDGPATHKRNATSGPIDGIWGTPGIVINKGGYFAYDEVFLGTDHRCLWIDVPFTVAFGHNLPPTRKRTPNRLHCRDPRLVDNYIRLYHQFAAPLQLFERVKLLDENARFLSKTQVIEKYEELDALRCEAAAFAEGKCRKLHMGQIAFSPKLQAVRNQITAWVHLVNRVKGKKVSSRLISRSLKKANLESSVRAYDETLLQENLKEAYKEYYKVKGSAKELRQTALESLAEAIAAKRNASQEKVLKSLREREKQRSVAKKIRYLRGKTTIGSTTMVTITDASGNKIEITNQTEMEQAILDNNYKKFLQSSHTPFYRSPLKERFGFKGLTSSSQAVLAGLYDPDEDTDQRILDVIAQWQMPQTVRDLGPLQMNMTVDSYTAYWKKARENTSCYPSALSFSTMKAGAFDSSIAALDCAMTRLPLIKGFAPQRWKRCLDVMIMKKSGVTDLSGLRTIVLFPVDCNYAFKHVGRQMMKVAEKTLSLAPEQYGSRKQHRAIDLAVNKALTFDILRQLKRSGAICSNDAKSCYDLIGHTQAALSMQRVGVPKTIIDCLFTTLQDAIHQVRTGFGDSKRHYGGPVWLIPIHGIGQGNGAGPAIWAVVSTPLLNVLREKGFGCEIVCPLSSLFFKFVGYAFVDDTDMIQSKLVESPEQVQAQLQEAIDTWEFSLKTTCGALVPEKTVWWLVSFKWSGNSWHYASIQDSPGGLQVNDIHDNRKLIKRLEPHQAYETLGVFLAPDGNLEAQAEKMGKAVKIWVDGLRTGRISKDETWLALQSTILRTLSYPLPATRFSKIQCEAIMAPLLRYCLPALGICRNFPRKLVYSTYDYMGLYIQHLHTLQEIARLKDIIFHTFNETLTGKLYLSSLELLLLELGCSTSYPWTPSLIDMLSTATLIKASWTFLHQHHITLKHTITLQPPRDNDSFIMESLLSLNITPTDLLACNHCRLYLRAIFLSDIVTGDGEYILDSAWWSTLYYTP